MGIELATARPPSPSAAAPIIVTNCVFWLSCFPLASRSQFHDSLSPELKINLPSPPEPPDTQNTGKLSISRPPDVPPASRGHPPGPNLIRTFKVSGTASKPAFCFPLVLTYSLFSPEAKPEPMALLSTNPRMPPWLFAWLSQDSSVPQWTFGGLAKFPFSARLKPTRTFA